MNEIWKDIVGYEGLFQVSSLGRFKSNGFYYTQRVGKAKKPVVLYAAPKILSQSYSVEGYLVVSLTKNGKTKQYKAHRIIGQAFIPNPEGKSQINHKNGIKDDNRIENLEWVTPQENTIHAHQTGLCKKLGHANFVAQINERGETINVYKSALSAAKAIQRSGSNLAKICRQGYGKCGGYFWKYISEEQYLDFVTNNIALLAE